MSLIHSAPRQAKVFIHLFSRSIFDVVLMAMERYTDTKKIQYSCTASLYFIVKLNISSAMNLKMKRKILSTLLNVMYAHRHDTVVVRNSCLILCQFELPHAVVRFLFIFLARIALSRAPSKTE